MDRIQAITAFKQSAKGYKHMGWANAWTYVEDGKLVTRPEVQACRDAGHQIEQMDVADTPHRGYDNMVVCHTCRYTYHVDSSD